MGGGDFLSTKQKVKSSLKESAYNLVELYKQRQNVKGFKYPKDNELTVEFENAFSFKETEDQQIAISDVKGDMESDKIMDRLICGDVGFGKTEVALRAMFKVVMAGRQVMFLCPTTILSQQHFNTVAGRMLPFGVKTEVLNRFKTTKETSKILCDLAEGKLDIICGTHRLLSKDVCFKNLGLLVLDEEQKFGVNDKEKIKNLKNNVDVLTLTATPIPRTMHMAMSKIRDVSVISSPPVSRIPVITEVLEYCDNIIVSAIQNELNRDGQILIVFNRIDGIYNFADKIRRYFPFIKIGVVHGRMDSKKLEDEIFKLYNNELQILISTTLIENGIDLPNANTLIVIEADKLGLSQLYQLKGRIGRSNRQAFAYFTYDKQKVITEDGYKRLEAIVQFSGLGSGFKLALRDLEIRGAGNIFGAEQHGHMAKVGYYMYLQLLQDAVNEIQGKGQKNYTEVKVECNLPAFIPHKYIESNENRISEYYSISRIKDVSELEKEIKKLTALYGNVPSEVENLCKIAIIKNLCSRCGFVKAVIKNKCYLQFEKDNTSLLKMVVNVLKTNKLISLNLENLPIINFNNLNSNEALNSVINFLKTLK